MRRKCNIGARREYTFCMNTKQYSFSDFTRKMVINVCDGRELGHVCDMIFNNCGSVLALVVPGKKSLFKSLTSTENIFIPFNRIVKIGSDVILTDVINGGVYVNGNQQDGKSCNRPAFTQEYSEGAQPAYDRPAYAQSEQTPPTPSAAYSAPPANYPPEPTNATVDPASPAAQTFYHTS